MTDTFSVAMCTYNGARYLSAQLESLATQTRLPDELVICDDGSVDDTVPLVEKFAVSAPFTLRLEINNVNLGSTKNFEKAIQGCKGDLIALADQDDVWLPRKLEVLEAEFQHSPKVGLVFSDAEIVDDDLRPLDERLWTNIGFDETARQKLKTDRRMDVLLPGWTVTGATMAFRSKFRALVLPIPNDLPMIHDGWIAAVIATVAAVSFIEQPLIKYRQHERQQIGAPSPGKAKENENGNFRDAMRRPNSYAELIAIGDRLRTRLLERSDLVDSSDAIRKLDARINHLRTRELMPKGTLTRVPHVLREFCTGRYHLYSNGFYSALKDLLG